MTPEDVTRLHPCACPTCLCAVLLAPAEGPVCADCQLGEHEGWDE